MKRLSDYKNEDAIELWAKLLDPIINIFKDKEMQASMRAQKSALEKAKLVLLSHKSDAVTIILAIDPTPITGLNLGVRLVDVLMEIENSEEFGSFFGSPHPGMKEEESSGSVTENTEEEEN